MTKLDEILRATKDNLTAKRVYGEPYEKDGVTVIPAAAIRGGGGGGEGDNPDNGGTGSGGGFGMTGRPVGAYRIKDGEVTWIPAADTTKVIVIAELIAIVALLVVRSIMRSRSGG